MDATYRRMRETAKRFESYAEPIPPYVVSELLRYFADDVEQESSKDAADAYSRGYNKGYIAAQPVANDDDEWRFPDEMTREDFSIGIRENVLALMDERGMSAADVGRCPGLTNCTINNLKNARSVPTAYTLAFLCKALGTTPNEILSITREDEVVDNGK